MAIPNYQSFLVPFLRLLIDEKVHRLEEIIEKLAMDFMFTDEDKTELVEDSTNIKIE
ncbi:winged helix-turn-helix domain-containing protein [Paenibacillus sp. RC67]|uniref:winged helix-turn-helix domain-containing protein n=1 Tax=Paenibacillus sp. RC67 TaxID=3039392 RepID=UPI0024AE0983|nr:winged helix-turn-helix domain-containing protein [Paenibacillus sp. RC67]